VPSPSRRPRPPPSPGLWPGTLPGTAPEPAPAEGAPMWPSRKPPPAAPARPRPDSRPTSTGAPKTRYQRRYALTPQAARRRPQSPPWPAATTSRSRRTRAVSTSRPPSHLLSSATAQGRHGVPAAGAVPAVPRNGAQRALPAPSGSPPRCRHAPRKTRARGLRHAGQGCTASARRCPGSGFRKSRPLQGRVAGGSPFRSPRPHTLSERMRSWSTPLRPPSHPKTKKQKTKTNKTKNEKQKRKTPQWCRQQQNQRVRTSPVQAACRISRADQSEVETTAQHAGQNVTDEGCTQNQQVRTSLCVTCRKAKPRNRAMPVAGLAVRGLAQLDAMGEATPSVQRKAQYC
jgi:hypothetical protein